MDCPNQTPSIGRTPSRFRCFVFLAVTLAAGWWGTPAHAQLSTGSPLLQRADPVAELEERLVNRLKATRVDQRAYLKQIVQLVDHGTLDLRLVVAIERYALRRKPHYPFPFFERALNYQARKRGTVLPSILHFQDITFADGSP